jgi:hypothetical protein
VELKEENKRKRWEEGGNFFKLAFHPGRELFFFSLVASVQETV